MVELRERRELAPSARTTKRHQRQRAISGNGAAIGTVLITTHNYRKPDRLRLIRKDPMRLSILLNLTTKRKSIAVVHSSATINIARATSSARAARAKLIPARTISAFV